MSKELLLQVQGLTTRFNSGRGVVHAVNDIDFSLSVGDVLCVVGESGCGKTVTMLSLLGLLPTNNAARSAERILFDGRDMLSMSEEEMREILGKDIGMVFQDPMTSLNPVLTIGRQLTEAMEVHQRLSSREASDRSIELLRTVGIADPEQRMSDYPHQFSGGMRQRVMIAMALSCDPILLIADEPTTALDVTVQAQILELVIELMRKREMGLIWITHDLGVVAELADWVAVMYAGHIVEYATVEQIFAAPRHPYTIGLLDSMPSLEGGRSERLSVIPGQPPNLIFPSDGCPFADRCSYAFDKCSTALPSLMEIDEDRQVACWWDVELDMERSVEDR